MGQVCAKHNEYYEVECRWCEPVGGRAAMPDNLSANIALLEKLKARGRVVTIPGGNVPLVEMSYAEAGMHQPAIASAPPPLPWPATLDFIPPPFRFVDAKTGKPVPLVGKHFPSPSRDVCALCGMSGAQITQDPTSDCDPNDGHGAFE